MADGGTGGERPSDIAIHLEDLEALERVLLGSPTKDTAHQLERVRALLAGSYAADSAQRAERMPTSGRGLTSAQLDQISVGSDALIANVAGSLAEPLGPGDVVDDGWDLKSAPWEPSLAQVRALRTKPLPPPPEVQSVLLADERPGRERRYDFQMYGDFAAPPQEPTPDKPLAGRRALLRLGFHDELHKAHAQAATLNELGMDLIVLGSRYNTLGLPEETDNVEATMFDFGMDLHTFGRALKDGHVVPGADGRPMEQPELGYIGHSMAGLLGVGVQIADPGLFDWSVLENPAIAPDSTWFPDVSTEQGNLAGPLLDYWTNLFEQIGTYAPGVAAALLMQTMDNHKFSDGEMGIEESVWDNMEYVESAARGAQIAGRDLARFVDGGRGLKIVQGGGLKTPTAIYTSPGRDDKVVGDSGVTAGRAIGGPPVMMDEIIGGHAAPLNQGRREGTDPQADSVTIAALKFAHVIPRLAEAGHQYRESANVAAQRVVRDEGVERVITRTKM